MVQHQTEATIPDEDNLSVRIREERMALGMTQQRLAEVVGTSHKVVSLWETGKTRPIQKFFDAMTALFGWDLDYTSRVYRGGQHKYHGERHHSAKLFTEDVVAMRDMYAEGTSDRHLAKIFGVSRPTVHYIVTRKIWKHVP